MTHGSIAHQAAETQKVGFGVARYAPMGKCLVAALSRVIDAYSTRVAKITCGIPGNDGQGKTGSTATFPRLEEGTPHAARSTTWFCIGCAFA
jgi:hypothetical protein